MHVMKFQADTLDEALKNIKQELGPDAIILKTVTNKGLKGAFKKKKIEITAAISEKSFVKKSKVDTVLNPEEKKQFYKNDSSFVANMIESHSSNDREVRTQVNNIGYGNLGLNKVVQKTEPQEKKVNSTQLDDFLSGPVETTTPDKKEEAQREDPPVNVPKPIQPTSGFSSSQKIIEIQDDKIRTLESKLNELTRRMEVFEGTGPVGVLEFERTLKRLGISPKYSSDLIRKIAFEIGEHHLDNEEQVFEQGLKEMMRDVNAAPPIYFNGQGSITLFISESSVGQTSTMLKIGTMRDDSLMISYQSGKVDGKDVQFSESLFNTKVEKCQNWQEVISQCRKGIDENKSIFIDFKNNSKEKNEVKKLVNGLRRSFQNVEILLTLSSIHTEQFNQQLLTKYKEISDGIVMTHLDLCLGYGPTFNMAIQELPLKLFSTGDIIPEDLETATSERIIAGLFNL